MQGDVEEIMSDQDQTILICPHCGKPNRVAADKPLTKGRCGACKAALSDTAPIEIDGPTLEKLMARDTGNFVVDLWAPWCGPCRTMAPAYEATAAKHADRLRFFKLNTDAHQDAAARLNIRGIPTLIAWRGGRQAAHQAGAMPQSALMTWIETHFPLVA